MKTAALIFALFFLFKANCQEVSKQLQKQMWYVSGEMIKGDTCSIHLEKPHFCSGYLSFNKEELEIHLLPTENLFACKYEILNNKLKLYYTVRIINSSSPDSEVELFYKLSEKGHNFDLTPISEAEYNNDK